MIGKAPLPHVVQYRFEVPSEAQKVSFTVIPNWSDAPNLWLMVRRGSLVGVRLKNDLPAQEAFDKDIQAIIQDTAGSKLELQVDSTNSPLLPGATYYLLLASDGPSDFYFELTAEVSTLNGGVISDQANQGNTADSSKGDEMSSKGSSVEASGCTFVPYTAVPETTCFFWAMVISMIGLFFRSACMTMALLVRDVYGSLSFQRGSRRSDPVVRSSYRQL